MAQIKEIVNVKMKVMRVEFEMCECVCVCGFRTVISKPWISLSEKLICFHVSYFIQVWGLWL